MRSRTGWHYRQIAAGSDLTGDGRPDLVASDSHGARWLHAATGAESAPFAPRGKIGLRGWRSINHLTATGNIAGGPTGDLLARDTAGVLWLYQGRGDGTFTTRVRIGGGWNAYTHIIGIGGGNRDGHPDLYATPAEGRSYLYKGTGNATAPFRSKDTTSVLYLPQRSDDHIA
ncbi:VCBS repeat-containing protein [Streptomyces sp. t39]|uniref:VCBS repeat-containing protein n=1 Tax=Streptomyces sp. t39 TaxID=1828156 RepID=UPI0011CE51A9|nr:VCBS repeat-containing protein [Streptomyces sp. t39]TXS49087.1 hypothetical protein EAO77_29250 [Streptomyces sp. t39]